MGYCWEDKVAEVTAKKKKLKLYGNGDVFQRYGIWVKCVPAGADMLDCSACMFSAHCDEQRCVREYRTDGRNVIFRQATEEEIAKCKAPMTKMYSITADDKALEGTHIHESDAEQLLKDDGYENEGEGDWSKSSWTENEEAISVIYARIDVVDSIL